MSRNGSMHAGHRGRMKEKYMRNEDSSFNDHEILELLLFYSVPRGDTNEIAHRLVDRFGSIDRMTEASFDELKLVDGIGDNSAILLKLVLSLAKRYSGTSKNTAQRIDDIGKMVMLARQYTVGAIKELVYATYFDSSMRMIDTCLVACGTVNEVKPMMRAILELCILKRASSVLVFHNHPSSGIEPSRSDIEFTRLLERELEMIGAELAEHIIIDPVNYFAIRAYLSGSDGSYTDHRGVLRLEGLREAYETYK